MKSLIGFLTITAITLTTLSAQAESFRFCIQSNAIKLEVLLTIEKDITQKSTATLKVDNVTQFEKKPVLKQKNLLASGLKEDEIALNLKAGSLKSGVIYMIGGVTDGDGGNQSTVAVHTMQDGTTILTKLSMAGPIVLATSRACNK